MSLHAAHISFIKLFRFTEPIFEPKKLEDEIRFLSNPRKIKERTEIKESATERRKIEGIGTLKRIKNIDIFEDNFWVEFNPESPASSQSSEEREPLPYYPFQLLPPARKLSLRIPESEVRGSPILYQDCSYQIRLYPPGIGSFHLRFYYKQQPLNWKFLEWMSSGRRRIFNINGRNMDFPDVYDEETTRFFEKCCKSDDKEKKIARRIKGYYKVINVQGELEEDTIGPFLIFLDKMLGKEKKSEIMTPYEDRIIVGRKACVLYLDKGVKTRKEDMKKGNEKERRKIRRGRRCFRSHIIDTLDLAYTSLALSEIYADYINRCLIEIEAHKEDPSIFSIVKDLFKKYIYDPNLYSTVCSSLYTIPENLEEIGNIYIDVYRKFFEVSHYKNLEELSEKVEILHEKSKEFGVKKKEKIEWLYKETQEWALGLLPMLKGMAKSNNPSDDTNTEGQEE